MSIPIDPEVAAALEEEQRKIGARKDRLHQNYLRRKANGKQKDWEEKYKPRREARKAELESQRITAGMSVNEYRKMREATRTEEDMPEGMIGYEAAEVVRKANAANADGEESFVKAV